MIDLQYIAGTANFLVPTCRINILAGNYFSHVPTNLMTYFFNLKKYKFYRVLIIFMAQMIKNKSNITLKTISIPQNRYYHDE